MREIRPPCVVLTVSIVAILGLNLIMPPKKVHVAFFASLALPCSQPCLDHIGIIPSSHTLQKRLWLHCRTPLAQLLIISAGSMRGGSVRAHACCVDNTTLHLCPESLLITPDAAWTSCGSRPKHILSCLILAAEFTVLTQAYVLNAVPKR